MDRSIQGRRDFLQRMSALGALSLPGIAGLAVPPRTQASPQKTAYDPAAKFEIKVSEVEFRRTAAGRKSLPIARAAN